MTPDVVRTLAPQITSQTCQQLDHHHQQKSTLCTFSFILYSFKKWQIKSCRLQRDLISDCLIRRWSYWPLDLCSIFFSQTSLSSKFSLLAVWSDLFTINFVTKISYFGGFFKKCHFLSKNCCDTFWATFNKVWATFHFSIWLHCSLSWSVRLEVYLYFKLFIYF